MENNLIKIIDDTVESVRKEQTEKLDALYKSPEYILRKKEKETLISLSINLKTVLMNAIVANLEGKVPYVNTLWLKSTEKLTAISYGYITWEKEEKKNDIPVSNKNPLIDKLVKNGVVEKINSAINTDKLMSRNQRNNNRKIKNDEKIFTPNIAEMEKVNRGKLNDWCEKVKTNLIENIKEGDSLYG
ncbi:MAG: hypothetical protein IKJ88_07800 [Clostridia bacterium]|nr:hypothetical protein [Clostridia bacterium]